jgi:hypothetical protein
MMEPQEIEDEGHERIVERVAAIDVAKASGMVCVRVPRTSRPGRRVSRVWEVAATTGAVTGLGDHLACQGIEKVSVEAGQRLLADLVLPAGGGRPEGAAGQCPRGQEHAGPAEDGQARQCLAG